MIGWQMRARMRQDSGASAVEAALVLPLVLLLTFGIIEFALFLRDYVGTSNAVRDAVRTASAQARQGNVLGHQGPCPPANPTCGAQPSFAYNATQILKSTGTAIPSDSIDEMWVYLANAKGYPSQSLNWRADSTSNFTSCPAATCVSYGWVEDPDPDLSTFKYKAGSWDPAQINACPGDPQAMAVGVYMRVDHDNFTGLVLGDNRTITDHSVIKFEPLRLGEGNCRP